MNPTVFEVARREVEPKLLNVGAPFEKFFDAKAIVAVGSSGVDAKGLQGREMWPMVGSRVRE